MLTAGMSDLELFFAFCQARSNLFRNYTKRISNLSDEIGDVAFHSLLDLFEFLYMLRVTEVKTGDDIAALAQAHNEGCERLLQSNPADLTRIGLNKTKVKEATFSERNISKLRYNYDVAQAIDQSDVSRFLFKHMSRETARKSIIIFGQANILQRINAGDSVMMKSNGVAEDMFGQYIHELMLAGVKGSD